MKEHVVLVEARSNLLIRDFRLNLRINESSRVLDFNSPKTEKDLKTLGAVGEDLVRRLFGIAGVETIVVWSCHLTLTISLSASWVDIEWLVLKVLSDCFPGRSTRKHRQLSYVTLEDARSAVSL